jgi:hypothetical protein
MRDALEAGMFLLLGSLIQPLGISAALCWYKRTDASPAPG